MTNKHRQRLEKLSVLTESGFPLRLEDYQAIAAALADLDAALAEIGACRAALAPVARDLRRWDYLARTYDNIAVGLTKAEAVAVLAAVGGKDKA